MRILKWTLEITDIQTVTMPAGAKILDVQMQHGKPQVWALCDETGISDVITFYIHGTGNPVPDNPGRYIATFQERIFVWHVFERTTG